MNTENIKQTVIFDGSDTPSKLWILHWMLWLVAVGGVAMLMTAKGHYSIDVIIAYFVTTRLWYIHHSIIANKVLHQKSSTNYLSRYNSNRNRNFRENLKKNVIYNKVVVVEIGSVV